MRINIYYNSNSSNCTDIVTSIKNTNGIQNYFKLIPTPSVIDEDEKYLNWDKVADWFKKSKNGFCIHIVDIPFSDNWFSHEESNYSVITTAGWNDHYSPPSLIAYLIYQIAQSAINFEANLAEKQVLNFVHNHSEGCMFDFCKNKTDIKYGMRVGAICPKCKSVLSQYKVHKDAINAIEKILDYVRLISIGRWPCFEPEQVYIVKHYDNPSAIHNAFIYGVQPALQQLGLRPLVGYQRIGGGHFFNSIIDDISSSKMVVVLIDSTNPLNNQNAYLEYGLAKGMNKDVLIVCESNFITNLPSDMNGMYFVEYDENDLDGLRNKLTDSIERFLNIQVV